MTSNVKDRFVDPQAIFHDPARDEATTTEVNPSVMVIIAVVVVVVVT